MALPVYTPKVDKTAWIHSSAVVHGQVTLKEYANIWPGCVLRGDINKIVVGKFTNIQDTSVMHVERELSCTIGDYCVVGHRVILHGCKIGNGVLVGMGAIVLNRAIVGDGALIGAGALVTEGTRVKGNSLYLGAPARFIRKLRPEEIRFTRESAKRYVQLAKLHADGHFLSA